MRIIHITLFILLTLIFWDCSEVTTSNIDDREVVNKITINLNGGSFLNESHTIETPLLFTSGASFDSNSSSTFCKVYGAPSDIPYSVDIVFSGYQTGSYDWEGLLNNNFINIYLTPSSLGANQFISTTDGLTTISSYGNVGESVIGNFIGKFVQRSTYDTVTINGNFSIQRVK